MNFRKEEIKQIDLDNMAVQIDSLYLQIQDSISIMSVFPSENDQYKDIINSYNKILIIGMGGSAIGGDFARKIIEKESPIPVFVLRDYDIPNWVDKKTFIIASSYSGNTEETLSAYSKCLDRGCNSIVISTGGELSRIANNNDIGVISLPPGYQPRAAIGYSLSILLLLFVELGLCKKHVIENLQTTANNCLGKKSIDDAKLLAQNLYNKFPVIYSGEGCNEILSIRLKGQLAENAKILSYQSVFPEHNHNEIEGWNNLEDFISNFSVIWIIDDSDSEHIRKRIKIVKGMIDKYTSHQCELYLKGESIIERVFSMIHTIDWVSFYLAIIYKTDPSPVNNIKNLKSLMNNEK